MNNDYNNSALKVNKGISQPPSINPHAKKFMQSRRQKKLSVGDYINGIRACDRKILSQAITLIESVNPDHQETAFEIIEKCLPYSGKSFRIGITGVPGVGKSTFIESFGEYLTDKERKIAVLAIDPSSEKSKGSILGDKTRMEKLSSNPNVFIRPSPSAGNLGGVAGKTRESIILCEAAGFDTIFIETVGVGQSETTVSSMVDFFLLLMLAGAGDELQGIKRGIMEMADTLVITKADGGNNEKAQIAASKYKNALHLFPAHESGWPPNVLTCSALFRTGFEQIWESITTYFQQTTESGYLDRNRKRQAKYWMFEAIEEKLRSQFYHNPLIKQKMPIFEKDVLSGQISSHHAARELLELFKSQNK